MRVEDFIRNLESNNLLYKSPNVKHRNIITVNEDVEALGKATKKFKNAIKELKNNHAENFTKNQIEKKVNRLKEAYNSFKESYDSLDEQKKFSNEMKKMDELFTENKKALKKLGIDFDKKGKMTFDKSKLDKIEDKDITKLCSGTDSFIYKIYKLAGNINKVAEKEEVTSTRESYRKTIKYSAEDVETAQVSSNLNTVLNSLTQKSEQVEEGLNDGSIVLLLKDFSDLLNKVSSKNDAIEKIIEINETYKSNLDKVGLKIDEGNKEILYQEQDINDIESYKQNYTLLFGEEGEYKKEIYEVNKNILDKSLKMNNNDEIENIVNYSI